MRFFSVLLVSACAASTTPDPAEDDPADPAADTDVVVPSGDTDGGDPPDPGDTGAPPPPEPTPLPEGAACTLGPHTGSFTVTVNHNGRVREALVDLPPGYDGSTELPVVLNFYGNLMNATLQRSYSGMSAAAGARNMIAVHPNGLATTWNVLPGSPEVGFVDKLLDALAAEVCVDPSRIYFTGMSQGGNLSYLLSCNAGLSRRVAAIAPVAGSNVAVFCSAANPVPVWHIHGTGDAIVDYEGGLLYPSAPDSAWEWATDVNNCRQSGTTSLQVGAVTCETRCSGRQETTLCSIAGAGHTWPGALPIPLLSDTNYDIDATEVILDFFERHAR
jgi:polyhydroxybutyrate depolymerase